MSKILQSECFKTKVGSAKGGFPYGYYGIGIGKIDQAKTNKVCGDRPKCLKVSSSKVLALVLTIMSVLLAACSSSPSGIARSSKPISAISRVQLASAQLIQDKTVAIAINGNVQVTMGALSSLGVKGGRINMSMTGGGNMDYTNKYFSLNLNITPSYGSAMANANSGSQLGALSEKIIVADDTAYLQDPFMMERMGNANQWYSFKFNSTSWMTNSNVMQVELENPTMLLKLLESAGSVTKEGSVNENGQSYSEYKVVLSSSKLMSLYPKVGGSATSGCLGNKFSVPVTILINSQNQLYSLTIGLAYNQNNRLNAKNGSISFDLNYSMIFTNYGKSFNEFVPKTSSQLPSGSSFGAMGFGSNSSFAIKTRISSHCY